MLFSMGEIAQATAGRLYGARPSTPINGVVIDSRAAGPGDLFVALAGQHVDGHRFTGNAINRGAAGLLVAAERYEGDPGAPRVEVEEPLVALGQLATWYRGKFSVPVIGVTGSVGKTTTKEMIAAVLSRKLQVLKTYGNYNNEIGVPLSVFAWRREHDAAVFELAMRAIGDIALLADIVQPRIGVITQLGTTHYQTLGSVEAIAAAKGELISALPADGTALLNGDDALTRDLASLAPCPVIYFGTGPGATIRGTDARPDGRFAFSFQLTTPRGTGRVRVPSPGLHLTANALAAAAVGHLLGLSLDDIAAGLAAYKPAGPRLEVIAFGGLTVLDDSYNAAPASMRASLAALRQAAGSGRAIAVLGDMLELGDLEEAGHAEVGEAAAAADYLFAYGPLMAHAVEAARRAGMESDQARHFASRDDLIAHLLQLVAPGDTVLVKGSRGMDMGQVVAALKREWQPR